MGELTLEEKILNFRAAIRSRDDRISTLEALIKNVVGQCESVAPIVDPSIKKSLDALKDECQLTLGTE